TGRQLQATPTHHPLGPMTLALSGDGRVVATGETNSGLVALHDRATGRLLRTLDTRNGSIAHVAFVPKGALPAVSGSTAKAGRGPSPQSISFWNAETGQELRRLEGASARDMAFSPDGSLLAAAADTGVRLWEVLGGREQPALPLKCYRGLAFSPDG